MDNGMNEDEMRKVLDELGKVPGAPKALRLTIRYDEALQKITGRVEEPMFMSEGGTFIYLLQNVFMAYPDIERQYPPGTIGFTINGVPPWPHSPLFDGYVVAFSVHA